MCGITGFFGPEDKILLRKMTGSISHRGPDQSGYYSDSLCSLGHRRLSIIDLSEKGKQPMANQDGTLWIVFNGEIYNYKELKSLLENKGYHFSSETDTEVIIYAYEEFGANCLAYLNGIFAFAIWDTRKKELFIARDRIGVKPLYYFTRGNVLVFASEIKALCHYPEFNRTIHKQAIDDYLNLRFVPGPDTIFSEVKKLQPGHYLLRTQRGTIIKQYWSFVMNPEENSVDYFAKKVREQLEKSVAMQMVSDVPIGAFLSGGIDSSAVVACMAKASEKPIHTYSVTFLEQERESEMKYARLVAEKFKTEHKEIEVYMDTFKILPKICWHMDEPFGDPAALPTYILAEETKKYATVILTGDGPDEIFGGYEQYRFMNIFYTYHKVLPSVIGNNLIPKLVQAMPKPVLDSFFKYSSSLGTEGMKRFYKVINSLGNNAQAYYNLISVFTQEEKKELFINDKDINIKKIQQELETYLSPAKNKGELLNRMLYYDTKVTLPDDFLMKVDKTTMANSIEARVPYLDHTMVELAAQIPARYKMDYLKEKYILKRAMKDVLPREIIQRKKERFFVPIDDWLSKELKEYAENSILTSPLIKENMLNKEYIEKIFRNHSDSKLYYSRQIWNLMNLALWYKLYIEEEDMTTEKVKQIVLA